MVFMLSLSAGRLFFNAESAKVSVKVAEFTSPPRVLVLGSWFLAPGSYTATCCNIATTCSDKISTS